MFLIVPKKGFQHIPAMADASAPDQPSPRGPSRVANACDACRLRKVKCNGRNPCDRCRSNQMVCVFSRAVKPPGSSVSPAYVAMLEAQQQRLVTTIKEMAASIEALEARVEGRELDPATAGRPGGEFFDLADTVNQYDRHSPHKTSPVAQKRRRISEATKEFQHSGQLQDGILDDPEIYSDSHTTTNATDTPNRPETREFRRNELIAGAQASSGIDVSLDTTPGTPNNAHDLFQRMLRSRRNRQGEIKSVPADQASQFVSRDAGARSLEPSLAQPEVSKPPESTEVFSDSETSSDLNVEQLNQFLDIVDWDSSMQFYEGSLSVQSLLDPYA